MQLNFAYALCLLTLIVCVSPKASCQIDASHEPDHIRVPACAIQAVGWGIGLNLDLYTLGVAQTGLSIVEKQQAPPDLRFDREAGHLMPLSTINIRTQIKTGRDLQECAAYIKDSLTLNLKIDTWFLECGVNYGAIDEQASQMSKQGEHTFLFFSTDGNRIEIKDHSPSQALKQYLDNFSKDETVEPVAFADLLKSRFGNYYVAYIEFGFAAHLRAKSTARSMEFTSKSQMSFSAYAEAPFLEATARVAKLKYARDLMVSVEGSVDGDIVAGRVYEKGTGTPVVRAINSPSAYMKFLEDIGATPGSKPNDRLLDVCGAPRLLGLRHIALCVRQYAASIPVAEKAHERLMVLARTLSQRATPPSAASWVRIEFENFWHQSIGKPWYAITEVGVNDGAPLRSARASSWWGQQSSDTPSFGHPTQGMDSIRAAADHSNLWTPNPFASEANPPWIELTLAQPSPIEAITLHQVDSSVVLSTPLGLQPGRVRRARITTSWNTKGIHVEFPNSLSTIVRIPRM